MAGECYHVRRPVILHVVFVQELHGVEHSGDGSLRLLGSHYLGFFLFEEKIRCVLPLRLLESMRLLPNNKINYLDLDEEVAQMVLHRPDVTVVGEEPLHKYSNLIPN